jgi:hypothetical protein
MCMHIFYIFAIGVACTVHSPCVYDVQLNNACHCSRLHYKVVAVFCEPLSSLCNSSVPGDRFFFMHVKPAKVTQCAAERPVFKTDVCRTATVTLHSCCRAS